MSRKYRKVSDDEISEYMGLHEIGSPQYHIAQNRKRAAVRRSERPAPEPEVDVQGLIMLVLSVIALGIITLIKLT